MISIVFAAGMMAAALPPAPERPHDPWIFRSVLDQRPRMVTLALHEKLWVGYDATTCALYKAWDGGVKLDGAVYTTVHGPQPTSRGDTYTSAREGATWRIVKDGLAQDITPVFRGYRIEESRAVLMYDLPVNGEMVRIEERPEASVMGNGQVMLERWLTAPDGLSAQVFVAVERVHFVRPGSQLLVDGLNVPTAELEAAWDDEWAREVQWVGLKPAGGTSIVCIFPAKPSR